MLQSQKLEAMGTLTGGIAHDFNNILSVIMGYSDLAVNSMKPDHPGRKYITELLKSTERSKDLITQILTFSHQNIVAPKPLMIRPIVKEVIKLLKASFPSNIIIRQDIPSALCTIMAEPIQIHQILMNICTNSRHAMVDHGGKLDIKVENVCLNEQYTSRYQDVQPGPFLKQSITDSGQSIPHDIIDHIFDPYFTTKAKDKGTGLGLSVVHGIVRNYKGLITVKSQPGKGTTFNVYIPAIESVPIPDKTPAIISADQKAGRHVLFIDDEIDITQLMKIGLQTTGFCVKAFTDSRIALTAFESAPQSFDAVITDMTMPDITGDILAMKIKNIRPDIPIILCTGFSEKVTPQNAHEFGIDAFVFKPYLINDLVKIIGSVLPDGRDMSIRK